MKKMSAARFTRTGSSVLRCALTSVTKCVIKLTVPLIDLELQARPYRSMQDHIREIHPEYYIPKVKGTKEGFLMMINRPPSKIPKAHALSKSSSFTTAERSEHENELFPTAATAAVTTIDALSSNCPAEVVDKTQCSTGLTLQTLPCSWNEAHPADKMMFYMRQEGAKWKDIARKWRGLTGGE